MEIQKELAVKILDEFETYLANKGIHIPNDEREVYDRENESDIDSAILFGSEYYSLEDSIIKILNKKFKPIKNVINSIIEYMYETECTPFEENCECDDDKVHDDFMNAVFTSCKCDSNKDHIFRQVLLLEYFYKKVFGDDENEEE